jgi:ribonuclease J
MISAGNDELLFLPLGGAGEIGMNLSLYGWGPPGRHRWLMIDCGIGFNSNVIPGADILVPDPAFIVERREQLVGLVLTHAHEDHLGAVPYLWPELGCPVFATPFACAVLRRKLAEETQPPGLRPMPIPANGHLEIGPFALQVIGMTHSVPEARAVVVRTPGGTILHTGDWKLDPDPVVGPLSDEAALRALGDEGLSVLVCDSTNVFVSGNTGSEGSLAPSLRQLVAGCPQRVVVTCFASNVARLATIAAAAHVNGRAIVMAGNALKRNYAAARECGYLGDLPPFLDDTVASRLPRRQSLIVCTGGQGEPRAALSRMASGEHPRVSLEEGDTVIFSSRVIPGNELAIGRLQNMLLRLGVEVITDRQAAIHVSGHPARGDLERMYALVRPAVSIPVHGEFRHMLEHARLARMLNVPKTIIAENGTMVRLAPGPAEVIDHVPAGRLSLEGNRLVPVDGELVQSRTKAIYNGTVAVTVVLERIRGAVREVLISCVGVVEQGEEQIVQQMREAVCRSVEQLPAPQYEDDESVADVARLAVRRAARQLIHKRPLTHVHVVRV